MIHANISKANKLFNRIKIDVNSTVVRRLEIYVGCCCVFVYIVIRMHKSAFGNAKDHMRIVKIQAAFRGTKVDATRTRQPKAGNIFLSTSLWIHVDL